MTEFQNRGNIKMKNSIKKIAIVAALFAVFAMETQGATNRLGKIKSTDSVVVSEDDPWFFQWAGNNSFMWPFGTTSHGPGTFTVNPTNGLSGFWIGTNTIAELLQPKLEDETDPEFDKVKNATSSISLGGDTTSGNRGIAIGVPSDPNYADGDFSLSMDGRFNFYYWRSDYMANA